MLDRPTSDRAATVARATSRHAGTPIAQGSVGWAGAGTSFGAGVAGYCGDRGRVMTVPLQPRRPLNPVIGGTLRD